MHCWFATDLLELLTPCDLDPLQDRNRPNSPAARCEPASVSQLLVFPEHECRLTAGLIPIILAGKHHILLINLQDIPGHS